METPSTSSAAASKQGGAAKWVILAIVLTTILVASAVAAMAYVWMEAAEEDSAALSQETQRAQEQVSDSLTDVRGAEVAEDVNDTASSFIDIDTSSWSAYEDEVTGFRFSYPSDFALYANDELDELYDEMREETTPFLQVYVEPLLPSEDPRAPLQTFGIPEVNGERTAVESLSEGSIILGAGGGYYGIAGRDVEVGGYAVSDEYRKFEVCDVQLTRELRVQTATHLITLRTKGGIANRPSEEALAATALGPELLEEGYLVPGGLPSSCSDAVVWSEGETQDVSGAVRLGEDLKKIPGAGPTLTQEWYTTFDKILSTVALP